MYCFFTKRIESLENGRFIMNRIDNRAFSNVSMMFSSSLTTITPDIPMQDLVPMKCEHEGDTDY